MAILETGIGGKYDSTNFIESGKDIVSDAISCSNAGTTSSSESECRLVVVIASISLDHQALLGYTIEEICHQKCGIIKPHSHVFTATTQVPVVLQIIRDTCVKMNATYHEVLVDKGCGVLEENKLVAVQVMSFIKSNVFEQSYFGDTSHQPWWDNFFWPCRHEVFQVGGGNVVRVRQSLCADPLEPLIFVLDGCHNGDSVMKFMQSIDQEYHQSQSTPCTVYTCVGIGVEKLDNIVAMLEYVGQYSDHIFLMKSQHFKAMGECVSDMISHIFSMIDVDIDVLYGHLPESAKSKVLYYPADVQTNETNVAYTLRLILQNLIPCAQTESNNNTAPTPKRNVIVACGSLFVAAEVREYLAM